VKFVDCAQHVSACYVKIMYVLIDINSVCSTFIYTDLVVFGDVEKCAVWNIVVLKSYNTNNT